MSSYLLLPWRKPHDRLPDKSTLSRWRKLADERARQKGAEHACHLCKRPIGDATTSRGCYGWVELRVPGPWRVQPQRRRICYSCWLMMDSFIKALETHIADDNLPPEVIG